MVVDLPSGSSGSIRYGAAHMVERLTRDVTARGVRMRVVEAGSGPPLILIHDFLVSHLEFESVLGPLAERFRVFAPDLPGFGESEKPSPARYAYGIEAFAEAMVDMIAGLELGRVAMLGHSLGGAAAITLAAEHPELVERLVLVDAMSYPFRLDFRSRLPLVPLLGRRLFKQLYGRGTVSPPFPRQRVLAGLLAARSSGSIATTTSSIRRQRARAPTRCCSRSATPGRSSRASPASPRRRWSSGVAAIACFPLRSGSAWRARSPERRLDVLDAGHSPNEERPQRVRPQHQPVSAKELSRWTRGRSTASERTAAP